MTSRIIVFLMVIACGLYIVCSDSSDDSGTGPDNPNGPSDSTFTISQQPDDARAQSGSITASSGGTLSATDASGVTYTLTVPAHSLGSSAYLTLTPLQSFTIAGAIALGSGIPTDSTCVWLAGLLCKPSGLVFDSGASLTIALPDSIADLIDTTAFVTYINDTAGIIYGLDCEYDTLTSSFTCTITHFSDYVVVDIPPEEDPCDLMNAAYYPQYSAALYLAGTEAFVPEVLRLYEMKNGNIRRNPYNGTATIPCPSFNDQVDSDIALLIGVHWQRIQLHVPDNSFDDVDDIIGFVEQLHWLEPYAAYTVAATALEQTLNAMRLAIDSKLRALAAVGQQQCQDDNCDGRDILQSVYGYGADGWLITTGLIVDSAYLQQLQDWIDDCCNEGLSATLSVPVSNRISQYGIDPDEVAANIYHYVCSLEVRVTLPSGTPASGRSVRLFRNDETHHFASMSSNEDGIAAFTFRPGTEAYGCSGMLVWNIRGEVYNESVDEWIPADNSETVTFVSLLATTTISYSFHSMWQGGELFNDWTATLNGSGTGPIRQTGYCADACSGQMERTYQGANTYFDTQSQSYEIHSWNTVGPDSVYACRAVLDARSHIIQGHSIQFVYSASVALGDGIFAGLVYESNTGGLDTLQYGLPNSIWPEEPLIFYATEQGIIGDTLWTDDITDPGTGIQYTANLQIVISTSEVE